MLPQPRTLLPGIPAPSPHSPVLPLLHYPQPHPAPHPQDREHTTMMNRAGATKAQMAPFPSDSQQLWRDTEGYISASPHPLQRGGPASTRGQGQCRHGDHNIVNPNRRARILLMISRAFHSWEECSGSADWLREKKAFTGYLISEKLHHLCRV